MSVAVTEIAACRLCGSERMAEVLSLGNLAINAFPEAPDSPLDRAPLVLVECQDCTLVQLRHSVDRERLYRTYHYASGLNESMVAALADVVDHARRFVELRPGDSVWDIGANDGTLLGCYPAGVERIGWEPATRFWGPLTLGGATLVPGFFPDYFPDNLAAQRPKVITAIAMFYALDDPGAFVAKVKLHLHPEGVFVVQMAMLEDMLERSAFDNICHEHLEYYSVRSFLALLQRHGLRVADVQRNAVNGGSWRFVVKHAAPGSPGPDARPGGMSLGRFRRRIHFLRADLVSRLEALRYGGQTVLGYGASTKGNTLLQVCGIGPELVPAIAERQREKWGRYTLTGIPIISEAEMRERRPDYLLALPWHFVAGFVERERELLDAGTKFLVPLPSVREVSRADLPA